MICGERGVFVVLHISAAFVGEVSALHGAAQAASPGVVHINAGAAWRDEEAVGCLPQDITLLADLGRWVGVVVVGGTDD